MTREPRAAHVDLVLYGKPGCHLCEDARAFVDQELSRRRAASLPCPILVERNILANPGWERVYFETIPVLSIGGRELPLAIRPAVIRAFLDEALAGEALDAQPLEA